MTIDELTPMKQVKIRYWLDIIRQCRESGLTNNLWCEQNDIPIKQYYYWLAKIRKLAIADLPRRENGSSTITAVTSVAKDTSLSETTGTHFVQLAQPFLEPTHPKVALQADPLIVITVRDVRIEITASATPEILTMVLKAVRSC